MEAISYLREAAVETLAFYVVTAHIGSKLP